MRTFARYLALEAPGWVLVGVLVSAFHERLEVGPGAAAALVALWVVKDLALYRWLRPAFEPDSRTPVEKLVGAMAVVTEPLAPEGYLRLGAELWRAEASPRGVPIPAGARVRVREARGLTLVVERAD